MRTLPLFLLLALAVPAAGATTLTVQPGESIQAAINRASPGDTIRVLPGSYRETVFIDKNDIRLQGVVAGGRWAVLDGGGELNDGVLASGHGVIIERLWVRNFKGNGIMTQGSNNYQIIDNVVEGPCFYAIFPQFGRNGLVARNYVTRSHDAAIYVGMSDQVDVVNNVASHSVIGIETENSRGQLIEGNYVHDNVLGIATTMLPGLPVKTAHTNIIRRNFVVDNNTANFAPPGAITAAAPSGVGILVLGTDGTVVEDNYLRDNHSVAVLVADTSFFVTTPDAKMDPYPDGLQLLRNTYIDNGADPQGAIRAILGSAGLTGGIDVLATGKGRDNCVAERGALRALGINRFADCAPGLTSAARVSLRPAAPVAAPQYTPEQVGRLTYLAVCSGCHTYNARLVGPPMLAVKALYAGRPQALADWIAQPTRRRTEYPEMPPQAYLPEHVRRAVADYILDELEN